MPGKTEPDKSINNKTINGKTMPEKTMPGKTVLISGAVALIVLALLVALATVSYNQQRQPLTLYGNVDIRNLNISFRVSGRLASLHVDEGDRVQAGQILGRLDDQPYQIALRQAKASLAIAQANYDLAKAGYRSEEIAQVSASVQQAQAASQYAESFYQRQQNLWRQGSIASNDLENARSARNQAQAQLQALQDKLTQYRSGNRPQQIQSALASTELARAQLENAQLQCQDTTLVAPASGIILTRTVEPGSIVSAGGTIYSLSLTHPVWVRAYASERDLGEMQPGRAVLLTTDSRPHQPYHGKIGFVSPTAEFTPKTVETTDLRTDLVYRLRIIVTDADEQLRQGMPVTITVDNESPDHQPQASQPSAKAKS